MDSATSIHALFRHGSRYPTKSKMKKQRQYFPDFDFPYGWEDEGKLTDRGKMEHRRLGTILRNFLAEKYKNSELRATHLPRAYNSMYHFLAGSEMNLENLRVAPGLLTGFISQNNCSNLLETYIKFGPTFFSFIH